MRPLSGGRVMEILGLDQEAEDVEYPAIVTDTRRLPTGALFVALKGERHDGHDFLAAAREAGARGAVVRTGTSPVEGLCLHPVEDTLRAYGWLARAQRREIPGPVVAVTGTNGKTSTKELVAAALATRYQTHATRWNLNNLVGVPQTILTAPDGTESLVIEAGANLPGEIARYREIVEPTVAVVTNVAAGHLEGFGSLERVMAEKLELIRDAPLVVVGPQPPALAVEARARRPGRLVVAGLEGEVRPDEVVLDPQGRPTLRIGARTIRLPLVGRHLAGNAMLAWAVAEELGLDLDEVADALSRVVVPGGRSELQQVGGLTILNDCYNANPASFLAAIETARSLRAGRRLVFVAGGMRELGPEAGRLHEEVAAHLVALAPELLVAVGEFAEVLRSRRDALGDRLILAGDPVEAGALLAPRLSGDEVVILKASRGVALERILPAITSQTAPSLEA